MNHLNADDPRHGTDNQPMSASVPRCDCTRCDTARTYKRRRAKQRLLGQTRRIDPTRVLLHITALRQHGWNHELIARVAGISQATVSDLVNGRTQRVHVDTAAAILRLEGRPPYDTTPGSLEVPAYATVRRLQALAALGWPLATICTTAGLSRRYGSEIIHRQPNHVDNTTAVAIRTVYDRLHTTRPADSPITRAGLTRARNRGWLPPAAWDDIDDPHEHPASVTYIPDQGRTGDDIDEAVILRVLAGDNLHTTHAERDELMRRWLDTGHTRTSLENRFGWAYNRYAPDHTPHRHGKVS